MRPRIKVSRPLSTRHFELNFKKSVDQIEFNNAPELEVLRDPDATAVAKTCAIKNFIVSNANKWFETHLSSCKSYKLNNHSGKRLSKINQAFDRVFQCQEQTTDEQTTAEPANNEPATEELPECGCYAQDEEILIENDKCVLDLGTSPGIGDDWTFTFDLKVNSLPTEPSRPPYNSAIPWYKHIISGIDFKFECFFEIFFNSIF